jgi:hypothetical protein
MDEFFDSSVRSTGDLAGVFEYDGETSYFYLYATEEDAQKVLGAIHVLSGDPDFAECDIAIRWDESETKVGLFIREALWAIFDNCGTKFGGDYRPGASPQIPIDATQGF